MISRIFLLCFCLLSSQAAMAFSYTVEISEKEMQQKVSAMMPVEMKRFQLTAILSSPKVSLIKDSNEVAVFLLIDVLAPGGLKASGSAKIRGSLSYDDKSGEFFFKNPTVEEIEVTRLPEKYLPKVKEIAQLAADKTLSTRPFYTLKDDNIKHKLAKSMLKSVSVKDEKLLVVFSAF